MLPTKRLHEVGVGLLGISIAIALGCTSIDNATSVHGSAAGFGDGKANNVSVSPPQKFAGDALLRGMGPSIRKSLELLLVSRQPLFFLIGAVVLVIVTVGVVSEQVAMVGLMP